MLACEFQAYLTNMKPTEQGIKTIFVALGTGMCKVGSKESSYIDLYCLKHPRG